MTTPDTPFDVEAARRNLMRAIEALHADGVLERGYAASAIANLKTCIDEVARLTAKLTAQELATKWADDEIMRLRGERENVRSADDVRRVAAAALVDQRDALRAKADAMRPLVDATTTWLGRFGQLDFAAEDDITLAIAVRAYLTRAAKERGE